MATPPPQVEVWVHNVDYDATAKDLALYFRDEKDVPVVRCQMRPYGSDARQNLGNAILTLSSVVEYEKFIERAMTQGKRRTSGRTNESFTFSGRTLNIEPSFKSSGSSPKDSKKVFSFDAEVRIGVFRGHDEFLLAWNISESSSSPPRVVVDFQSKCVKISYHDKQTKMKRHIEYHAHDVDGIYNVSVSSSEFLQRPAYLLRTTMAPKLFEEDQNSSSSVDHQFLWELAATDRMSGNARRSLDFSPNRTLSVYRDLLLLHDAPLNDPFIRECTEAGWKCDGDGEPWRVTESPLQRSQVSSASLGRVSFRIKFLLETLFSERILYKDLLPEEFYDELDSTRVPKSEEVALAALDDLRRSAQELENGNDYVNCRPISDPVAFLRKTKACRVNEESHSAMKVYHVLVTPLTVQPWGLEHHPSNRVLREYDYILDHFVRLSFTDEDGTELFLREGNKTAIIDRLKQILKKGIVIADRSFDFLGMSSSQMRKHSCWFFAKTNDPKTGTLVTVDSIQKWMGDFSAIDVVAKYAARMGQCFTTTVSTKECQVNKEEFGIIEDTLRTVEERDAFYLKKKEYNFTDGIGKISPEFAEIVYRSTQGGLQSTPSAFQIRFSGCKGVVAVDPHLSGGQKKIKLQLRKSMLKFESDHNQVEVCNLSSFDSGFLNRQIILLLSTLGVKDQNLLKKQREMLQTLDQMSQDTKIAVKYLKLTAALQPDDALTAAVKMMEAGFQPNKEPFVHGVLQSYQAVQLDNLRQKARIFVESAALLMGVIDETNSLEYGQIFVRIDRQKAGIEPFVVSGHVAVTKNPCFHPGDIRVLEAVKVDKLSHLVNVVVFPAKGCRPHTDEISGSDLDGDKYFVTWDPDLLPPEAERHFKPMDYEPSAPQKKSPITLDDVKNFFIDVIIRSDQLGRIDHAHLAHADSRLSRAKDPDCIRLAEMHSEAVDFPKTGVLSELPDELRPKAYPDFMQKTDKISYLSRGILNKLFCQVLEASQQTKTSPPLSKDSRLDSKGYEGYLKEARALLKDYNSALLDIMRKYGVQDEWTMITGNVTKLGRFVRRNEVSAVRIEIREKMQGVFRAYRQKFYNGITPFSAEASAKASALYHATYAEDQRLLSCPWIVVEELTRIKESDEGSKR